MSLTTGQKIKNFRKRAQMSQFDLELEINASPGSISRIENSNTEPTKETLYKISDVLELNKYERDYLYGSLATAATDEEVKVAQGLIEEYFSRKGVLAYMLDDRYRLISVSKDFAKFFGFNDETIQQVIMQPLIKVMLLPEFNILQSFSPDEFEDTLRHNFSKYYYESSFMQGEQPTIETMDAIAGNPTATKVWEEILADPPKYVNTMESRTVVFKIGFTKVKMVYSVEFMANSQRYLIIEYTPENAVLKFLQKII